jgi:glycosyltransferase involved in cell wall biosynthesis
MSTIRIARILGRPNVGGPVRTVQHLTRKLAAFGYETLLLVGVSDEDEGDALAGITDGDGFTIRRIPSLRRSISLRDFVARRELERALAAFRPALVHTHAAKAGALGRRAAFSLAARPKIVHTYHGHSLAGYFPGPVAKCFAWIERGLARRSDAIVAVSERVRHELAEVHRVAPAARIEVIANGIDLAPFPAPTPEIRAAARAKLGCDEDRIVLLVPARLVPIKDHAFLFAAMERMGERAAEFEVHLCGDGPLRRELESRAAALRGVRVVFHGLRNDLPDVLPGADIVALTSKNEGMSLALIEAMASGAAIVATNVGGTPDLIEDGVTGRLVAAGDVDGLAATLTALARDGESRTRLGIAARARALEHHGIDRVVAAHDALYRRVLA